MAFEKNKPTAMNSNEVKASVDSTEKAVEAPKKPTPVEHVVNPQPQQAQRRLQQLPLTDVVIDTSIYGETFLLTKMQALADGRVDYQIASLKHDLDRLRVTMAGPPVFSSGVLSDGLKRVKVKGLSARIWQVGGNAGVTFAAESIELV